MKAAVTFALGLGPLAPRKVIRGRLAGAWARAASGHAAAPPRSVMKFRRLMQLLVEVKPTKGQRCASQQNWPADVAMGQKRPIDCLAMLAACPVCLQKRPNWCAVAPSEGKLSRYAQHAGNLQLYKRWHYETSPSKAICTSRRGRAAAARRLATACSPRVAQRPLKTVTRGAAIIRAC